METLNAPQLSTQINPGIISTLEEKRKMVIIYFFLAMGFVFFSIFAAISFANHNYQLALVDFSTILLSLGVFLWCYWKKNWNFISYFIVSCLGGIFSYLVYAGGSGGALAMWLLIYPLVAVFLLGLVAGTFYTFAMLGIAIFSMYAMHEFGGYSYLPGFRYRFIGIFFIVFSFTAVYEIGHKRMKFFLTKYMKRLSDTLVTLEERRKQHTTIMDYVDQGLFLLDEELVVQRNYSAQLQNILDVNYDIAGYSFFTLLEKRTFKAVVVQAEKYLELLLTTDSSGKKKSSPSIKKKMKMKNPLRKLFLQDPSRTQTSKLLSFSFRVIDFKSGAKQILVKVRDITISNKIKEKMNKEDTEKQRQAEVVFEMVKAGRQETSDFMNYLQGKMHVLLRTWEEGVLTSDNPESRQRTNSQFFTLWLTELHTIKGHASIVGFPLTADYLHDAEIVISKLNAQEVLGSDAVYPLKSASAAVATVLEHFENLQKVQERLSKFQEDYDKEKKVKVLLSEGTHKKNLSGDLEVVPAPKSTYASVKNSEVNMNSERNQTFFNGLTNILQRALAITAENQKKIANYPDKPSFVLDLKNSKSFHLDRLATSCQSSLKDALLQLVKNSVVHGYETMAERQSTGKDLRHITISIDTKVVDHKNEKIGLTQWLKVDSENNYIRSGNTNSNANRDRQIFPSLPSVGENGTGSNTHLQIIFSNDGKGFDEKLLESATSAEKETFASRTIKKSFKNENKFEKAKNKLKFEMEKNIAAPQTEFQRKFLENKIFSLQFTTRKSVDVDAGHGLGLAMVRKIIESCGGKICLLTSSVGIAFKITLPYNFERNEGVAS